MARDSKVTPITRNEPRTFYATRASHAVSGELWDLWTVSEGRRVGTLMVIDDGEVIYGMACVRPDTNQEELMDLMDSLYPPHCTEAIRQELMISHYQEEPKVYHLSFEE
ncbi:MAG: hypothetical protein KDK66_03830 [Deltaproteobacteria bacterium]|nr:hypothetical protein [Deltaproteobacteria bacterium]